MKEDVYISHNFLRISLREVWELEDTCIIPPCDSQEEVWRHTSSHFRP